MINRNLAEVKLKVYDKISFQLLNRNNEIEGTEYDACRFELNDIKIISRSSKITAKKVGQFVTVWKRNKKGVTEPFSEIDSFDFFSINARTKNSFGQFVFPKSVLMDKGIITTDKTAGKRGFRVYPKWDIPQNKQAEKTQQWQVNYFYEITDSINLNKIKDLYKNK